MVKIADSAEQLFNSSELYSLECEGKKICIARHNGSIFAFQANCPHAGAPMDKGYIDPLGNVVCPLHQYKFNMQSGRNVSGEGYFLKRYNVINSSDGIFIDI
jgi:3-phenylpropionate/trans-cinnamate dioxygenase ferredoxin subunit